MGKNYYVYMITNWKNSVIYTGVTSDLVKRIYEHKNKMFDGFSKRYNLNKLVYYEVFEDVNYAIAREKQIKAGSRKDKDELVSRMNPLWKDLYEFIVK